MQEETEVLDQNKQEVDHKPPNGIATNAAQPATESNQTRKEDAPIQQLGESSRHEGPKNRRRKNKNSGRGDDFRGR